MMLNESKFGECEPFKTKWKDEMQFFLAQLEILQKLHEDSPLPRIYTDKPKFFSPRDMLESNSVWCVHVIRRQLTNQSRQCSYYELGYLYRFLLFYTSLLSMQLYTRDNSRLVNCETTISCPECSSPHCKKFYKQFTVNFLL